MKFPNIASFLKSATTIINVSSATAPTGGQVLTATSSTTAAWQTPSDGGGATLKSVVFTTRDFNQAGGTQIITHGAGVIPKYAIFKTKIGKGVGSFDGTNNRGMSGLSETSWQTSTTYCINVSNSSIMPQLQASASNFTSTQMTLTWQTGTGNSATENIMIEFYG